jgi:hypothetical protein
LQQQALVELEEEQAQVELEEEQVEQAQVEQRCFSTTHRTASSMALCAATA